MIPPPAIRLGPDSEGKRSVSSEAYLPWAGGMCQ